MFYLIYKITNKISNKIYIGSHRTKNKNDGYMGSGKYLNRAYEKYGLDNFTKEILFVFNNAEEMYAKEAELVNEEFLSEENTYNLKRGGFGGWDYVNKHITAEQHFLRLEQLERGRSTQKILSETNAEWTSKKEKNCSISMKRQYASGERMANGLTEAARMLAQLPASQEKRIETFEKTKHQQGEKNSNFGTMWITNELENRKIKKNDIVPVGWAKGRVIDFANMYQVCEVCNCKFRSGHKKKTCSEKCHVENVGKFKSFNGREEEFKVYYMQTQSMNKALKLMGFPGAVSHYYHWAKTLI